MPVLLTSQDSSANQGMVASVFCKLQMVSLSVKCQCYFYVDQHLPYSVIVKINQDNTWKDLSSCTDDISCEL